MSQNHNFIATDYDDALLRLVDLATNDNVVSAAIVAGGTGYTVGDILDVSIGAGVVIGALSAQLEVTSVAAGVIDGIRVFNCGAYSTQPANAVAVTGGTGGDDATFNLTWETQNWVVERNDAVSTSGINFSVIQGGPATQTLEREVILRGPGSAGADEIYIGFLEVQSLGDGTFNWLIAGMTGFNALNLFEDQPGFSYVELTEIASFIALTNASIECWFHPHPRWLLGICRMSTTYNNFFAGFLNQYAPSGDFPYPLYLCGSTSKWNQQFNESGVVQSGLVDPGANTSAGGNLRGPAGLRVFDGSWQDFQNFSGSGASRTSEPARSLYPCGGWSNSGENFPDEDEIFTSDPPGGEWQDIIPRTGVPGTAVSNLFPSEDSGGDLTQLFETVLIQGPSAGSAQIYGEVPDIAWGSTLGNGIQTEDRVIIGGVYYRAFQNCNRTDQFAFTFVREDN